MADDVQSNPWSLDTVGPVPVFAKQRIKIHHIEFVGYAIAADIGRLVDQNGKTIWEAQGDDDFSPVQTQGIVGWVNGMTVDTLSGGTGRFLVYIAP